MPKSKQSTGLCGEHYVAALLAGSDLVVAVPRGGAAREDLFVANSERGRPLRVQVKTARDPCGTHKGKAFRSWPTDCQIIETHDESLWFAFVSLNGWPTESTLPDVLFVPSAEVAERMVSEKGKSRTFFWIHDDEAEVYKNAAGVTKLTDELG